MTHHAGADVEKFREWAATRTLLDDIEKPKKATCLRDAYNDELGPHVPVAQVLQTGQSLTFFAWSLYACVDLADALSY